jgi:hypothetical protein
MSCRLALCILVLSCLWCLPVRADEPAAVVLDPGIPSAWKDADSNPQSHRAQIATMIQAQVDKLSKATDTAGLSSARQWLVNERQLGSNAANTSSAYLDVYSDELNKAIIAALAQPTLPVRARVNFGIIARDVTEQAQFDNMLPSALALMKDKSDAVVLWGQRAALNLLRFALNGGPGVKPGDLDALRQGIVDAVANHSAPPLAGILAYEAYWGLNPVNLAINGPLNDAGMQCLILTNLGVQEARLKLYKSGLPEQPEYDTHPSEFLLDAKNWPSLKEEEQFRAVQCASDLIAWAGARAATLPSNQSRDLITALNHEAYYLHQLANAQFTNPGLGSALADVEQLRASSRPDTIRKASEAVYPDLVALQQFSGLKRPDVDQANAPAALPANLPDLSKETAGATGQGG